MWKSGSHFFGTRHIYHSLGGRSTHSEMRHTKLFLCKKIQGLSCDIITCTILIDLTHEQHLTQDDGTIRNANCMISLLC